MRLDVAFSPAGLPAGDISGRTVFVIDVLRATTAMCAAIDHGAGAVIPVTTPEDARRLAQSLGASDVRLAGERNCMPIEGFHLGNSPLEMTAAAVRGKLVVMTTTNGTRALLAVQGAAAVYPAAAANLSVAAAKAREVWEERHDLLVLCAGRGQAFALEDAYCAGRLVAAVLGGQSSHDGLNDAAVAAVELACRYGEDWQRVFALSAAGRELMRLGFDADVRDAARPDAHPVLIQFRDRRITQVPGAP